LCNMVTWLKTFVGKLVHHSRVYRTFHDTPGSWEKRYYLVGKNFHEVLTTREG
jgi:hypothetical protein